MSTYFPSGDGLADNRKWYVVDAEGQTVGRLATEVARVLTGKNKPQYTPFLDTGDHGAEAQRLGDPGRQAEAREPRREAPVEGRAGEGAREDADQGDADLDGGQEAARLRGERERGLRPRPPGL